MEYSSEHQRARALLIQCVCLRPHQSNPTSTTHTPSREVCHPIVGRAFPLMANGKAVRPDDLPTELLKLGLQQDRTILLELHRLTILIWHQGKYHSSGKMRSLPYSTRRATRRSAETTAASRLCHTRVRFSLKWLPGDSALTVRRRDCYRRSSAGFDRIARPRT